MASACGRHETELDWPDGPSSTTATEDSGPSVERAWSATLVLELYDGTTLTAVPRATADGEWVYDIALPPRNDVRTVSFRG